ncbi:MAG TPA: glycosyltransferase family 2 protein [Mycobacteriales bacterium]|nr:glycosyltransferase family 2 protein [Mycobacteriales bacterium]
MPPRSKQATADPAVPAAPRSERRRSPRKPQPADVLAVLVAHDGAEWLPEVLSALAASTRTPRAVVCVDTGSADDSAALMRAAYGQVVELPRTAGYGEAVAAAVEAASDVLPEGTPTPAWVWLLHDDVAVEPSTLERLLEHAADSPSAAMLGPKVRDWHDPRYLVEIGVTTDPAGHRETGLEHGERDQGQHDAVRDVLAVGTAAALVRRDAWDAVGGLDPHLAVFRDDLDLGWKLNAAGHRVVVVPASRVRHVRAATTGHRETDAAPGRASGIDRRNALYVLLAHAGLLRLLTLLPSLLLSTALRSVALLLTRQVGPAADEWRALLGVLGHPGRLHRARRSRRATRTVPQRRLRPLFASRTVRMRARLGALGDLLSGSGDVSSTFGALGDPGPEGTDAYDDLTPQGSGLIRSLLLRPGVLVFLGLGLVALLAERSVLALHGGSLHGGALLAPPMGASDLWSSYAASWHDVSVGTRAAAPPMTAVLALLSTVLLGKPWLAVDTLLLASVPLAGLTAYLAASRLVRHLYLRVWAALTWALLPVATGAVAAGRLDAAAAQVALPLVALTTGTVLIAPPREQGWWRVWALALGLSVTCAFAPLLWPLAAAVLVAGAAVLVVRGERLHALAVLLVAAVPLLLLFPWSAAAIGQPSLLLASQHPADADLPAWHLAVLSPGGPGMPTALLGGGLVLAALGGLVRLAFRRLAQVCWVVALLGMTAAAVLSRAEESNRAVWSGVPLQLSALALVVAALVAGHGVRTQLAGHSFGWRQLLASLLAVLAAAVPVVAALTWVVRGADDPLRRGGTQVLPAFAAAEVAGTPGLRVLTLTPRTDGRLGYDLLRGEAPNLAVTGLRATPGQRAQVDRAVADLASARGSDAAEALATRAVRYVVLRRDRGVDADLHDALREALDAQPGLVRRTAGDVDLWRVIAPSNRLALLPEGLAEPALAGVRAPTPSQLRTDPPVAVRAGREGASADVPAGEGERLLVLADAREGGWHASIDGKALVPATAWGWAQAFRVPASGGHLELSHVQRGRRAALATELAALLAVLLLSVPSARRRAGLEDDVAVDEPTAEGPPVEQPATEEEPVKKAQPVRPAKSRGASS